MTRIVYENEPFVVTPDERAALRRVLGASFRETPRDARIVGTCGQLRLSDGRCLVIRSRKAGDASLLAWLAYADPTLASLRCLGRLPDMADDAGFGRLVARVFCLETWRAIQTTGLLRAYHRQEVRSAVIRGRIDFSRVARTGGNLGRTPCVVFARLPHTPLNRLLAAAVEALRRDPELRAASGTLLAPLGALLAEVPPVVDATELSRPRSLSRLEQPFEAAAALARLIVRRGGLSSGDTVPSVGFLVNIAALFESAVARAFRDSALDVSVKHPVPVYRSGEGTEQADRRVPMEIDVLVRSPSGEPIVVDAKYKTDVSAGNVQQMAAYCWLTGARRAVLVFPAGMLGDRRSFVLPAADGRDAIRVDLCELELGGRGLSDWREAGRRLVNEAEEKSSKVVAEPAVRY